MVFQKVNQVICQKYTIPNSFEKDKNLKKDFKKLQIRMR